MSELNTRQWALYNFLKNNPDKMYTQIQVAYFLKQYYDISDIDCKTFHDSNTRKLITKDIRAINNSYVIQKIIISTPKGIKLASKEEFCKAIRSEYAATFRKLNRIRRKERKAQLDGQFKATFDTNERETIEAFTDSINRLKAARLNAGLTLREVVKELKKAKIGVDKSLLSKMENGICEPNNQTLVKLAEIYDISTDDLI